MKASKTNFFFFFYSLLVTELLFSSLAEGQPSLPVPTRPCGRLSICYVVDSNLLQRLAPEHEQLLDFVTNVTDDTALAMPGTQFLAVGIGGNRAKEPIILSPLSDHVASLKRNLASTERRRFSGRWLGMSACDQYLKNARDPKAMVFANAYVSNFNLSTYYPDYIVASLNTRAYRARIFKSDVSDPSLSVSIENSTPRSFSDALIDVVDNVCGHNSGNPSGGEPSITPEVPEVSEIPTPSTTPSLTPSPSASVSVSASASVSVSPSVPDTFGPPEILNEEDLPDVNLTSPPEEVTNVTRQAFELFVFQELKAEFGDVGIQSFSTIGVYEGVLDDFGITDSTTRLFGLERQANKNPLIAYCPAYQCSTKVTVWSDKDIRREIILNAIAKLRKRPGFKDIFNLNWKKIIRTRIGKKMWEVQFPYSRKYYDEHCNC